MEIWTIAAFATIASAGNLAGVALVSDYPSDEIMLTIASKLNYSETAFVKPLEKAGPASIKESDGPIHNRYEIRWFTPKYEVDLCGHATLAAAFLLLQNQISPAPIIDFSSRAGTLRAIQMGEEITLDFPFQTTAPLEEGLDFNWEKALGGIRPINICSAFGTFREYLVELKSPEEVINLKPDINEIAKLPGNGLIVTAKGSDKYDMVSRVFAPQDGIPEDPVCVSAHCKLAHYWEERLGKSKFLAYQASKRGGEIKIERQGNRVFLTGKAIIVNVARFTH